MDINNRTAIKIKEYRENKNISQKSLAKTLAMSVSAYSRLENGEVQITLNTLERLPQELNITISDILNLTTSEMNNFHNNEFAQKGTVHVSFDAESVEKLASILKRV